MNTQCIRVRKGSRGRFPIQPKIGKPPHAKRMDPEPKGKDEESIYIDSAEVEVLRLADIEKKYQEEIGAMMGVSRGTVYRLLISAREKVTRSIVEGRPLIVGIEGDGECGGDT